MDEQSKQTTARRLPTWETLLDRAVEENRPELKSELGSGYEAFLTLRTQEAADLMADLITAGMDPLIAREMAMQETIEEALWTPENPLGISPQETGDTEIESSSAED